MATLVWAFLSAFIVWWHLHFGMIQYGGLDGGLLVNIAWQEYLGAEPYRDFFTPIDPLFVFPAGWAFELLGPTWHSLLVLIAFFSVATFTWAWLLLRKAGLNSIYSLALSFAIQAMTTMPFSWWWYNQVTSVVAAIFIGSSFLLLMQPRDPWARLSFWMALFLLGLAKSNVAGPMLIVFLGALLWEKTTRKFTLAATLTAGLAAVAFLGFHGISVPLLVNSYLILSDRLWTPQMWMGNFVADINPWVNKISFPCIALLLAAPLFMFLQMAKTRTEAIPLRAIFVLSFMTTLSSMIGLAVNRDLKMTDAARCLVAAEMMALFLQKTHAPIRLNIMRLVTVVAIVLTFTGLTIGALRVRVFSIGPGRYAEHTPLKTLSQPAFFQGMQVGPTFDETIEDIATVLAGEGWPGNRHLKIFMGPRIDCCYAAFDVPVEPGLAVFWEKIPSTHHGENIPDGDGEGIPEYQRRPSRWIQDGEPLDPRVQRFIDAKFDLCLFCLNFDGIPNLTLMPPDLRAELYAHYHVDYHRHIAVFRRIAGN
ncbi:MAG: hypothetical protein LV481_14475 [Methylacidiphilales bacterium]|nr:hypothetical protein [Candidatus Methylacidiphilales bacterium]